jgi:hypothetical protein
MTAESSMQAITFTVPPHSRPIKKISESLDHANENNYLYASHLAHLFESLKKAVTHEEDNHRPAITGDCPAGLR